MIRKLINAIAGLGVKHHDPDGVKQEKNIIVGASIASGSVALIWGFIYIFLGEKVGGAIPLLGGLVYFFYLPFFARTGNIAQLKFFTFVVWLIVPTSAMWFLGGFYPSSILIIWSFIAVILALMTSTLKNATHWFYAYLLLIIASGFIQPWLPKDSLLPDGLIASILV